MPILLTVWALAAAAMVMGLATPWAALVNLVYCRYFFIHMRWKGVLRGMGGDPFVLPEGFSGVPLPVERERMELAVRNGSRRVVRVSSHFPFEQVNPRLQFDRASAAGFRLDLDAGSSERWGPGETRTVTLVRLGGERGEGQERPPGAGT